MMNLFKIITIVDAGTNIIPPPLRVLVARKNLDNQWVLFADFVAVNLTHARQIMEDAVQFMAGVIAKDGLNNMQFDVGQGTYVYPPEQADD